MATELAGKWKLDHSSKTFDDYLVKLGKLKKEFAVISIKYCNYQFKLL